jgi:cytochrome c-type biogenesis protein CcmH
LLAGALVAAVALLLAFHWRDSTTAVVAEATTASVAKTGMLPELAAHLEKHPRDARAWAIFARLRFSRGDYAEAAAAYARAVALPGKVARDPLVWCEYADALALAADGRLAGKPRELIDHALALNNSHPRALEMAGSAEIEAGNFAAALRYWEELLAVLPPDSSARVELARAVERTRMRAGR